MFMTISVPQQHQSKVPGRHGLEPGKAVTGGHRLSEVGFKRCHICDRQSHGE
jgi:hypothetical protein